MQRETEMSESPKMLFDLSKAVRGVVIQLGRQEVDSATGMQGLRAYYFVIGGVDPTYKRIFNVRELESGVSGSINFGSKGLSDHDWVVFASAAQSRLDGKYTTSFGPIDKDAIADYIRERTDHLNEMQRRVSAKIATFAANVPAFKEIAGIK